jgi:hypothetical protein
MPGVVMDVSKVVAVTVQINLTKDDAKKLFKELQTVDFEVVNQPLLCDLYRKLGVASA